MTNFEPPNFFEQIRSNHRRSMVLMAVTFLILWAFVNVIAALFGGHLREVACGASSYSCESEFYANPTTLAVTGVIVAAYLAIAYFSSSRAALAITHAQPATGPEYLQLRNIVEGVAIAAGVPTPAVYVVHDPAPNAFATGLKPEKAAVAVTTGLMERLSRRELEGVIAHEVGHIRNRDTSFMTLVVLTVGAIMVLSTVLVRIGYFATVMFRGGNSRSKNSANSAAVAIGLAFLAVGAIGFVLAIPAATLLKAALSRRREVMADATAVQLTRNPTGIRAALEKLEADTTVVGAMSTTTAHLWIESPLQRQRGGGFISSIGRLFDSHPPLAERIETLRRYEGLDPGGRGPVDAVPTIASGGQVLPPPTA